MTLHASVKINVNPYPTKISELFNLTLVKYEERAGNYNSIDVESRMNRETLNNSRIGRWNAKPKIGQSDTKAKIEQSYTNSKIGQPDTTSKIEQSDTNSKIRQADTTSKIEQSDTNSTIEKVDTKPKIMTLKTTFNRPTKTTKAKLHNKNIKDTMAAKMWRLQHCEKTRNKEIIDPFESGIPFPKPYDSSKDCVNLHFSLCPLVKTALASYPGSGTTWHRYLIQQLTGKR